MPYAETVPRQTVVGKLNKNFFLKHTIRPSQEKLMISDGKQYLIAYFPFDMSMNI